MGIPDGFISTRHSVSPPECLLYDHRQASRLPLFPCFSGSFGPLPSHPPALPHDFAFCNCVHIWVLGTKGGRSGMEGTRMGLEMDVCVGVSRVSTAV